MDDHRTERLQVQGEHGDLAHRAVALAGRESLYIPALCGEWYSKCKGTCGEQTMTMKKQCNSEGHVENSRQC